MRISDEELELFRDWQPGDSITIDANSVGMLIQEVIRARVALRAYNKLDDIHSNCTECEGAVNRVFEAKSEQIGYRELRSSYEQI